MSNKPQLDNSGRLRLHSIIKNPMNLFIVCVSASAAVCALIYLILGNGSFADIFFIRCADFYMDFFNSIRDAAQGSGVYTERGVIYPPMANLLYLVMSRFTPSHYNDSSFDNRYSWIEYFSPMMLVVMFTVACALVFFFVVYSSVEHGSRTRKFLFAFLAFFSLPVIFLIERGNIIILSIIALMIYAFTYSSESKFKRELGLICLAFAFSIKLYPVVFGWMLIVDKRYKDAVRCALYGLLMLIIPSFFFGGPICFYYLFQNIFSFSAGSGSTLSKILSFIHLPSAAQTAVTLLAYLWVLICGTLFAVCSFKRTDKPWRIWALGLVTILCVPSLTSVYNWAFFIIPIIMMCNNYRTLGKKDIAYGFMMIIPFMYIPFRINFHITPNIVLIYIATAALSVFAAIDALLFLSRKKK